MINVVVHSNCSEFNHNPSVGRTRLARTAGLQAARGEVATSTTSQVTRQVRKHTAYATRPSFTRALITLEPNRSGDVL